MLRGRQRLRICTLGFTLVELLVTLGIMMLLAAMLLPMLNRAQSNADLAICLNNVRQLQLAWQLYADDHRGRLPENYAALTDGLWRSSANSWAGPSSAPFDIDARALQVGTFYRLGYTRSLSTFLCPSDDAEVRDREGRSLNIQRSRSYSMNGNFGGRTFEAQLVIDRENQIYDASKVFVFIDEQEDSIDDAHFLTWPDPDDRWVNLPAGRHRRTGVLSFADGHAEAWHWKWRKEFTNKESYWVSARNEHDLADLRRLQRHIIQLQGYYRPQL